MTEPDTRAAEPDLPQLDGVEHRFIDLPGLRMHVAEAGRGDPVLLLHGFPQHWWEYRKVIPGLAERYRVICPDLRGAGWTDAPRTGYDAEQLLADLVALLDALDIDRVRVIAHDWSALVGFDLCLRHPDRVRAAIFAGVPHPWIKFEVGMLADVWRIWFQLVIVLPGLGRRVLGHGRQPLARYLLRNYVADPEAFSEEDIEIFLSRLRGPDRVAVGPALYRGFILPGAGRIVRGEYRDSRLSTPSLLLYGADDPGIKPEVLGGYEEHTDDMKVDRVENAAHFLVDDRPDVVVDRALEFFARH